MRVPSTKNFPINVTMDVSSTEKEIVFYSEDKVERCVFVRVSYYDENGKSLSTERYNITEENYDLLVSESPEFAPGKPANEYRENDLWYVIDLMSGGDSE